jgi:hypothetical protein
MEAYPRLGRNALDTAIGIPIDHDVADDEDP